MNGGFSNMLEWVKRHKLLISILLLVFAAILSHIRYILGDAEFFFNVNTDSFSQLIRMTPFLENNILDRQWSWSYGLGGDIFTEFSYYYTTSPFFYLQLFLKKMMGAEISNYNTIIVGKIAINIVRQSLAMIFMYILLLYEKEKKNCFALIGALYYGTAMFFLSISLRFDFMNDCFVWIPLTFLTFRYYERKKKIFPFLIAIAVTVANSFYFGFINCVFYGVYFLWFSYSREMSPKMYFIKITKIVLLCLLGIGISSIFFLPSLRALFMADRSSVIGDLSIIPDINILKNFYGNFFSLGGNLSVPLFTMFSVFFFVGADKKSLFFRKMIFMYFWLFLILIPFVGSMMNGFSYNSDRWHYVVVFSVAYFIPDLLEEITKGKNVTIVKTIVVSLICIILMTIYKNKIGGEIITYESYNFLINIFIIWIIASCVGYYNLRKEKRKKTDKTMFFGGDYVTVLLILILSAVKVYSFNLVTEREGAVNLLFGDSKELLVTNELQPESDEFFRVIDEKSASHNDVRRYENTSMNNGIYGVTAYNSMINGDLSRWIKRDYNIEGLFVAPSYYRGFDDRYFIETAWGVKYKINFDNSKKLPFGYSLYEINNGDENAHILKNKYDIGIDLWYDSIIRKDQFEQFDFAYRDSLLMQAAVVDNTENTYNNAEIDDVTFETNMGDWIYENCECIDGKIAVNKEKAAKITIPFDKSNFNSSGEYLFSFKITEEKGNAFTLNINNKKMSRTKDGSQWLYPIDYFSFKLDEDTEKIEISLPDVGIYSISDQRLYFNSYDRLDDWVRNLNKYNLENLNVEDDSVSGTINNQENGILALSMPYNDGWKCFVDGEERETLKVNGIFTGIELTKGKHIVKFEFSVPLFREAMLISLFSLMISAGIIFLKKHLTLE